MRAVFTSESPVVFPDPRDTGPEGVVAIGADLRPETLRTAYRQGIFPWPHANLPLLWFCPEDRAILSFDHLHVPESLRKARRRTELRFTLDQDFDGVIEACRRAPRPGQEGTWITHAMQHAYRKLHRMGEAHSVEAWSPEGELVGGLYGVDAAGVFGGESMFHRVPNASKLALLFLVEHLQSRGATFMDIQQLTPHMERLGAEEISRDLFLQCLADEQERQLILFPQPL